MPASSRSVSCFNGSVSRRRITALPKPSSPRNTFPNPAISVRTSGSAAPHEQPFDRHEIRRVRLRREIQIRQPIQPEQNADDGVLLDDPLEQRTRVVRAQRVDQPQQALTMHEIDMMQERNDVFMRWILLELSDELGQFVEQ